MVMIMSYETKLGLVFALPLLLIAIIPMVLIIILIIMIIMMISDRRRKYKFEKLPSDFKDKVSSLAYNENIELRKSRVKVRNLIICQIVSFAIAFISILISAVISNENIIFGIIAFVFTLIAIISMVINIKYKKDYYLVFGENIMPKILKLINNDLQYKSDNISNNSAIVDILNAYHTKVPDSKISNSYLESKEDYKNAKFDNIDIYSRYVNFQVQNFANISFKDNEIKINKVYMSEYVYRSFSKLIFNGIFVTVKCNIYLGDYNRIVSNNVINKENKEGEANFIILNNSNHLPTNVLELLSKFYNDYGINYELSYENNKIYFKFYSGDKLNPKPFYNSDNLEQLYLYYGIIKFIIDFTDKISNK